MLTRPSSYAQQRDYAREYMALAHGRPGKYALQRGVPLSPPGGGAISRCSAAVMRPRHHQIHVGCRVHRAGSPTTSCVACLHVRTCAHTHTSIRIHDSTYERLYTTPCHKYTAYRTTAHHVTPHGTPMPSARAPVPAPPDHSRLRTPLPSGLEHVERGKSHA